MGNLARQVAMALGRDPGGHRLGAVARAFGARSESTISVAASRLQRRLQSDAALAATLARLRKRLGEG